MRTFSLLLIAVSLVPMTAEGQSWSAQEQDLIRHVEACWQADDDGGFERWVQVCRPVQDMAFWWTGEPAPTTNLRWWRGTEIDWHQRYERISWDVRPMHIRSYGDVATIYYFWTSQLKEIDGGKLVNEQGGSMELFRRITSGWSYLGGMGFPIEGS